MRTEELLDAIREGRAHVEWSILESIYNGHTLRFSVFRDAMKFDGVPPMDFRRRPRAPRKGEQETYDGVRLPVNPLEMQQICDLTYCMQLTPKVVDMLWIAAKAAGTKIESIIRAGGGIVANADIHVLHQDLERAIAETGDPGGVIEAAGKYWVICKTLAQGALGRRQAVNYGWPTERGGGGLGVLRKHKVWQTIGSMHNDEHMDPSQTIRLMYRLGRLKRAGADEWEDVDLYDVLTDLDLAGLLSHEGPLKLLRQARVPEPEAVKNADGSFTLPEIIVFGDPTEHLVNQSV